MLYDRAEKECSVQTFLKPSCRECGVETAFSTILAPKFNIPLKLVCYVEDQPQLSTKDLPLPANRRLLPLEDKKQLILQLQQLRSTTYQKEVASQTQCSLDSLIEAAKGKAKQRDNRTAEPSQESDDDGITMDEEQLLDHWTDDEALISQFKQERTLYYSTVWAYLTGKRPGRNTSSFCPPCKHQLDYTSRVWALIDT
ncbi:hypothetical protein BJ508DRAFT_379337 [Ascobolus immersus RN42]|uniref:Uncharacterized protein n=1 Tax=Ascobolus immersus RN42 TaxID=1160509 RepID=A0A3N4HS52_ASCIM|nr:hypothetical protein BJ508DRAFT_379337 [Ascobolus immersus RN42]